MTMLWLLWLTVFSSLPSSISPSGLDGPSNETFSMKKSKKLLKEFLSHPSKEYLSDLPHLNWCGIGASDSKSVRRQRKSSSASFSGSVDSTVIGLGRLADYVNVDKTTFCRHLHHPILQLLSNHTDDMIALGKQSAVHNSTDAAHMMYRFAVQGLIMCPTASSSNVLVREVPDYIHLPHKLFQALADYWDYVDQEIMGRPALAYLVEKYDPADLYVVLRSIFPNNNDYVALFQKRFSDPHQADLLRRKMNDASTPVLPLFRISHALENDDYTGFILRMTLLRKLMSLKEYREFLDKAFRPILFWIFNDLKYGGLFQEDAKLLFKDVPFPAGILGLFEKFIKEEYCDTFKTFTKLIKKQFSEPNLSVDEKDDRDFAWVGFTRFFPYCIRDEWYNHDAESIPEYMMIYFDLYDYIQTEDEREQYYRWLLTLLDLAVKDDHPGQYRMINAFLLKGFVEHVGRDKIMKEMYRFFPLMDLETLIPRSEEDVLQVNEATQGLQYRINTINHLEDHYLCESLKASEALVNVFPFFLSAMESQNLTTLIEFRNVLISKSHHGKCTYIRDVVEAIQYVVSMIQQDEFEKETWILRLFYGKTPACDGTRAKYFLSQHQGNVNAKFLYNFALYFCRLGSFGESALDFADEFEFVEDDFRDMRATLRTLYELWYLDEKKLQVDDDINLQQHYSFYKTTFTLAFAALGSRNEEQTRVTEAMFRRYPDWKLLVFRGCKIVDEDPHHPNKELYIAKAKEFLNQNRSIHSDSQVLKYSIEYSYCIDAVLASDQEHSLETAVDVFHRFPSWFCVDVGMIKTVFSAHVKETLSALTETVIALIDTKAPYKTIRKWVEAMIEMYPRDEIPAAQLYQHAVEEKTESLVRYLEINFPQLRPDTPRPSVNMWQLTSEPPVRYHVKKKKSISLSCSPILQPINIPQKEKVQVQIEPWHLLVHEDVLEDVDVNAHFLQDVQDKIAMEYESKLIHSSSSSSSSAGSNCSAHSWEKVRNTPKHLPCIYRIKTYVSGVPYRVFFTVHDRTVYVLMVAMRNECYKPLLFSRTVQRAHSIMCTSK